MSPASPAAAAAERKAIKRKADDTDDAPPSKTGKKAHAPSVRDRSRVPAISSVFKKRARAEDVFGQSSKRWHPLKQHADIGKDKSVEAGLGENPNPNGGDQHKQSPPAPAIQAPPVSATTTSPITRVKIAQREAALRMVAHNEVLCLRSSAHSILEVFVNDEYKRSQLRLEARTP